MNKHFAKKYQEYILVIGIIFLAIFFRTIHYPQSFNFSSDQAAFSKTALEQWRQGELALQGPPFSFHIGEKVVNQGPFIYYLQLFFLLTGNFDPLYASLAFTIFSCLMIVPLYLGVKLLINKNVALLICLIFALTPYYILYTKFLWNPNYQLALMPLLLLTMGLFKKNQSKIYIFLTGFLLSVLLQLHYQFFLVLLGIFIYYIYKKLSLQNWGLLFLGVILAFSPFLYYELTHRFTNISTLYFFLTHLGILYYQNQEASFAPHYYLTLSFGLVIFIVSFFQKYISKKQLFVIAVVLSALSGYYFLPTPKGAYGMAENWNYQNEQQVASYIREQNVSSFNVTNLEYDSLYHVQKYLLKKDQISFIDNYYENEYLFALSKKPDLFFYPAYEINSFQPSKIVNTWKINDIYSLYLLEREI